MIKLRQDELSIEKDKQNALEEQISNDIEYLEEHGENLNENIKVDGY